MPQAVRKSSNPLMVELFPEDGNTKSKKSSLSKQFQVRNKLPSSV
jgi:hypothetical protein